MLLWALVPLPSRGERLKTLNGLLGTEFVGSWAIRNWLDRVGGIELVGFMSCVCNVCYNDCLQLVHNSDTRGLL